MDLLLKVLTLICQHVYDVTHIANKWSSEMMCWGEHIAHYFAGKASRSLTENVGCDQHILGQICKDFHMRTASSTIWEVCANSNK